MIELLKAIAAPLGKLLELALRDDYDAEAERQAMLDLQRSIYDERVKRLLATRK